MRLRHVSRGEKMSLEGRQAIIYVHVAPLGSYEYARPICRQTGGADGGVESETRHVEGGPCSKRVCVRVWVGGVSVSVE